MKKIYTLTLFILICAFHASAQYVTVWRTDNIGTSSSNQITIPATGTGYSIVWEEVGNPANNGTDIGTNKHTVTFPSAGTYQVTITPGSGTFNRIAFANQDDHYKLLEIKQWGDIQWASMENAYGSCYNLKITATDAPNLSNVTSMRAMFNSCVSMSTVPGINNWNVSSVRDMSFLFAETFIFNDPLNNWDVSNVTDMTAMFRGSAFNQPIGNWNVGNVTTMYLMFSAALSFNQPIGTWDVSNVTSMDAMFNEAESFNQPLNDWDVSKVTNLGAMFAAATSFNQPLNDWDVTNVQMFGGMFSRAVAFNQPIGSWNVSNAVVMQSMFSGATSFNQPLSTWDVGNVISMSSMFKEASAFNQPIGNWNVGQVVNMAFMFQQATVFNQPVNDWDVSEVTDLSYMFFLASAFNQPLNNWNLSSATDLSAMFYAATSFNQPLNDWDVSGVTNLFITFAAATAFNKSLSNWTLAPDANLTGLLAGAGLDCVNMSLTLQGWAANAAMPDNIIFGAQGVTYGTAAAAALATLRDTKNWSVEIGTEVLCEALDVSLISFVANSANGTVELVWATSSETDNDYFDVERSADARNWEAKGRVKGAGTVNAVRNYVLVDQDPLEGVSYYRLKIVDFKGIADYSNVRVVKTKTRTAPRIYPNPATNAVTISGKSAGIFSIYSLSGRRVGQSEVTSEKTLIPLTGLPAGTYVIKSEDGWSSTFIKN